MKYIFSPLALSLFLSIPLTSAMDTTPTVLSRLYTYLTTQKKEPSTENLSVLLYEADKISIFTMSDDDLMLMWKIASIMNLDCTESAVRRTNRVFQELERRGFKEEAARVAQEETEKFLVPTDVIKCGWLDVEESY